jgi:hypothetical protein
VTVRPGREAITLPLLFLTVALMGGFRSALTGGMRFVAPDLIFLVLGVLLLGAAFRSGLLVPGLLMSERRAPLENLSGAIVLVALFLASAQVVNILAPEGGLLHLLYCFFFAALLWNTMAAQPDRRRLLHSLFVILASAFLFKYVLLHGLYDPQGGLTRRVLTALLEGVALGTLQHEPFAPATGYVAFFTVVLYLAGLALLPVPQGPTALVRVGAEDVLDVQPT